MILSGGAVDSLQNITFLVLFFELRNTFSTKEIMLSSVKNLKIFRLRRALLPLEPPGTVAARLVRFESQLITMSWPDSPS